MSGEAFTLDTNILIYSIDKSAGKRHSLAVQIVDGAIDANCRLTLQSVSEFFAAVTRKQILTRGEAAEVAEKLLELFPTAPASTAAIRAALSLSLSGRASYWDALLVATAAEAGCTAILTEDLRNGTTLQGVRIINPFAVDCLSPAAGSLLGR